MKRLAIPVVIFLLAAAPAGGAGTDIEGLWLQGEALLGEGDVDGAYEVFSKALEADRDQPRSWNYIGGIHFLRGDFPKALLDFKQAFELDPGDGLER